MLKMSFCEVIQRNFSVTLFKFFVKLRILKLAMINQSNFYHQWTKKQRGFMPCITKAALDSENFVDG
ncbi:hypothetical protein Desor_2191 [Desulfosporosinus orientis DSM 765]|uniref:Uncharacterized protein n=1 Tax=Desulfosporosinus orientis (strain ATCC 19365 / DSM 765 / NCIMB 8382 / VKM B-1628 / Singapore I) TaxID=768706 RepID=G7W8T3_DESOD|nr:hypothetical protein Desor_2191 [Desulfosporosinus orientis DSM 765]